MRMVFIGRVGTVPQGANDDVVRERQFRATLNIIESTGWSHGGAGPRGCDFAQLEFA